MKYVTEKFVDRAFLRLPSDHEFESYVQFFNIVANLGEVDGDGSNTFLTRKTEDAPYGPKNVRLVNVLQPEDYDLVLHPAIDGKDLL